MRIKKYIFGYGSLVSPKDIARTLGRAPELIYPVTLDGWIREWGVVINGTHTPRGRGLTSGGQKPDYVVCLNIRRPLDGEPPTNPNGVLFEVEEADLRKLDEREVCYTRQEVTADVVNGPTGIVYAYVGLDRFLYDHDALDADNLVIIPRPYMDLVARSFAEMGPEIHDEYVRSTIVSRIPIHDLTASKKIPS